MPRKRKNLVHKIMSNRLVNEDDIEINDDKKTLHELVDEQFFTDEELLEISSSAKHNGDIILQDSSGHYPILLSCIHRYPLLTMYFIKMYPDAIKLQDGWEGHPNPLHIACIAGDVEMVRYLIFGFRFLIHLKDGQGNTPIFEAIRCNNTDIIDEMLVQSRGCSIDVNVMKQEYDHSSEIPNIINAKNNYGQTPLIMACINGRLSSIIKLLSCNEIDVSNIDHDGNSAFQYLFIYCCEYDCHDGDDFNSYNAFYGAIDGFHNRLPSIFHYRNRQGRNMLHEIAAQSDYMIYFQSLLHRCRSLINEVDNDGMTPLHVACKSKNTLAIRDYCDIPEINYNQRDHLGKTALHYLCSYPIHDNLISLLIHQLGLSVKIYDNDGNTALNYLVINIDAKFDYGPYSNEYGSYVPMEIIIEHFKFLVLHRNNNGHTILDLAKEKLHKVKQFGIASSIKELNKCCEMIEKYKNEVRFEMFVYMMLNINIIGSKKKND